MQMNDTIQFTNPMDIQQIEKTTLESFISNFQQDEKCATVVYPHMCLKDRFQEWSKINSYFKLHPRVKSLTDGFIRRNLRSKFFKNRISQTLNLLLR